MEKIRLIGRNSRLSLLQLEKVKQRIETVFSGIDVQIIARSSRGDDLPDIPLQTVEGTDFFTQDIFNALASGEADIAVHSLKDMSSEHFFGFNRFAVVDRDDTRDVVIFSSNTESKIQKGENIIIGTCSPRREEMAIGFLQKALPQKNENFRVFAKSIRGNVDTRLQKLDSGEYDGIILATAGLNRLLESHTDAGTIRELLKDKRLMLLPLIECVPAPCQGAIVAEANLHNDKAIAILERINVPRLMEACVQEKKTALQYGVGCLQKFGVTTIAFADASPGATTILYAAGTDSEGAVFTKWSGLPVLDIAGKNVFSTADHMGSFFKYIYRKDEIVIDEPVVYVANYKTLGKKELIAQLSKKKVWAAGTKTWFELAKQGIWVEGCADAFGLEFLLTPWQMPLLGIRKDEVAVLTNEDAALNWQSKGWTSYGAYATAERSLPGIEAQIKEADIIFWTSYRQYSQYRNSIKPAVVHVCSYGETAEQFKATGIEPVIFPNIKSFQQWRQISIPSRSVA